MSGQTAARKSIMQHKLEQTPEGEPLDTFTRNVQAGNGELLQNIPNAMHGILDIEKGVTLEIRLYHDGYFVEVKDSQEGDGSE